MLNFTNKSIAQALFVIGFTKDSAIRTKQFDIEKILTPMISNPSVNTNLPDDFNPQAPRITLRQGQISVIFSQITAQLTIDIDNNNGKSIETIRDSVEKKIKLFQSCVDKIIPFEQQHEHGLVITIQYPVDSAPASDNAVSNYIQSKFLKISPLGDPASTQFTIGYKTEDNYFFTLSVAQYQSFSGNALENARQNQWLDLDTLTPSGSGIELKIDINSRPMANQPGDVTNVILKKVFNFVLDDADEFIGVQK